VNIRYQADADLNQAIVTGVFRRKPEIDFQSASEAGLEGLSDQEVLGLAASQNRILVTHDRKTMPFEFAQFLSNHQSAGVLIVLISQCGATNIENPAPCITIMFPQVL
jgi:predicted nuclease of predicted toxin-antitoxin system